MAKARVLVADDNEEIREVLASVLVKHFDVIRAVSDGGAALAAVRQLLPDVAILDISMPVLNGIEVARRIRDGSHRVVVVFLTSFSDVDIFEAACDAGLLAYVTKDRLYTDLVPAVKLALNGARFVSPGVR
jgi:DNA-binding NarL/FixJ family response regulator